MKITHVTGSVLGLAMGDAFGAPFEGGYLEHALWSVIGSHKGIRRWTDDTQMTIDIAESLIEHGRVDQRDLAHRFAQSYKWSRGYGPAAAKALKRIRKGQHWEKASRSVYPEGSFGNGGAMRVAVIGLFYANSPEEEIARQARASAMVTHAHSLGMEGAALIALATAFSINEMNSQEIINKLCQRIEPAEFLSRLQKVEKWLQTGNHVAASAVATELGNGVSATKSCVTAVYAALAFRDRSFTELLKFLISLRGDVDTIAAMACAIWGATHGIDALPQEYLDQLEQREKLTALAEALARASSDHHKSTLDVLDSIGTVHK